MTKREILDRLLRHAPDLRKRFALKGLWLFGSVARDQARVGSDIDMVVEFAGAPTFDAYMDLKFRLEEILGARVDLVTRAAIRPTLKERIEKESVLVA